MKCNNVKMQLNCLVDDEIDHDIRAKINEHLLICASCQNELENIKFLKKHFIELEAPEISNKFEENLRQLTRQIDNKKHYKKYLPIAASFLLAIPLISILTSDKNIINENLLAVESTTIEETLLSLEEFNKWTQFEETSLYLNCGEEDEGGVCSIEVIDTTINL